jgi:hypothetical protein
MARQHVPLIPAALAAVWMNISNLLGCYAVNKVSAKCIALSSGSDIEKGDSFIMKIKALRSSETPLKYLPVDTVQHHHTYLLSSVSPFIIFGRLPNKKNFATNFIQMM